MAILRSLLKSETFNFMFKITFFKPLKLKNLISRKIWVATNFLNFHSVSLYEKKFKKVDFTNFFPKSYLLTSLTLKQWAAVTMIFSVISDPPQINSNFELACFLTEIWAIHGNWPTIAFWPPTILDPLGKEFLPQNSGCSMSKCLDVFAKDGKKLLSWKTAPFSLISLVSNFGGLINRERLKLWQNFVKMNRMKIFDVHTIFVDEKLRLFTFLLTCQKSARVSPKDHRHHGKRVRWEI